MSIDYQNSILWRGDDPTKRKFKPQYDGSKKIARYWAGKAPSWSQQDEEADKTEAPPKGSTRSRSKWEKDDAVVLEDASSSRLKRLSANKSTETTSERLLRRRAIHEAHVIEPSVEEREDVVEASVEEKEIIVEGSVKEKEAVLEASVEEREDLKVAVEEQEDLKAAVEEREDLKAAVEEQEVILDGPALEALEDEQVGCPLAAARAAARARFLQEEQDDDEDPIVDEEESEEESDSDGDEPGRGAMLKPVFVGRGQRETVREKEALKHEELEAEKKQQDKVKERKVESKSLLIDEVRREEEAEREGQNENNNSDIELIDDNDEINEAEEYELWKIRELKRIKRDKEERLERQKEVEFVLKRRAMTEEERLADDKRLDASSNKREETKQFNFLQKYYHRGAHFQDKAVTGEEPIYLRDVHEPLESEKFDKQLLPSAMQLRRGQFGKMGQTKHTHLTDVDTTDFQAAWSQSNRQVQRYQERMATAKGVNNFDRPSLGSSSNPQSQR